MTCMSQLPGNLVEHIHASPDRWSSGARSEVYVGIISSLGHLSMIFFYIEFVPYFQATWAPFLSPSGVEG